MKYELKLCSVCGSKELKYIDEISIDSNVFVRYKCNACLEVVSSQAGFIERQRATERESKKQSISSNCSAVEIFEKGVSSVLKIHAELENGDVASGSGFVVSKDGYVVTNAHVVSSYSEQNGIKNLAFFSNVCGSLVGSKERLEFDIVYLDVNRDLALLRFYGNQQLEPLAIGDYAKVKTGEQVYPVGNSKGQGIIITDGIVSDRARVFAGQNYIMITAPVNTGNSGGPLFNGQGEVVGVVVATEKGAVGMSYAIPSNELLDFIRLCEEREDIKVL